MGGSLKILSWKDGVSNLMNKELYSLLSQDFNDLNRNVNSATYTFLELREAYSRSYFSAKWHC